MPTVDPGQHRANRALGAALGAAGAAAAGYGAFWSGHASSVTLVTTMALAVGAGLGALTWGVFDAGREGHAWWFVALYGAAVGMLAGTFAGFPVGAVFGTAGGALGGVVTVAVWRVSAPPRTSWDVSARGLLAGLAGAAAGLLGALWMAS